MSEPSPVAFVTGASRGIGKAGLFALGVRSLVTDDGRYGWGTFMEQVNWDPLYYWVMADGSEVIHWPGDELRGEARKKIDSVKPNNTRYGFGGMKSWIEAYTRWMYKNRAAYAPVGSEVVGFKALIHYRYNMNRLHGGLFAREDKTIVYAPENALNREFAELAEGWETIVIQHPSVDGM